MSESDYGPAWELPQEVSVIIELTVRMKGLAIVVFLVKWLVVPLALLGLGYYIIGPRIGASDTIATANRANATKPTEPTPAPMADVPTPRVVRHGDPEVEVTVRRGSQFRVGASDRPRRHRKRRKKNTTNNEIGPLSPRGAGQGGNDAGGSGGTTGVGFRAFGKTRVA